MTESRELVPQSGGPLQAVVKVVGFIVVLVVLAAIAFAYSQAIHYWNSIHV